MSGAGPGAQERWAEQAFRVVRPGPLTPWQHMALDQAMAEALGEGGAPTLRFWDWDRPAVVLGSFQSVTNEVDDDGAARHGVTLVRRISGGGTMFVEPAGAITYSLVVPISLVAGMSFAASYEFLDAWVVAALRDLGVDARYVPLNDIATPAGKIAGAAQKRFAAGVVLHHTTMAYRLDNGRMREILRTGRESLVAKGTRSADKHVDPLDRHVAISREAVVAELVARFRAGAPTFDGEISAGEWTRTEHLVATKFSTPEWTHRLP